MPLEGECSKDKAKWILSLLIFHLLLRLIQWFNLFHMWTILRKRFCFFFSEFLIVFFLNKRSTCHSNHIQYMAPDSHGIFKYFSLYWHNFSHTLFISLIPLIKGHWKTAIDEWMILSVVEVRFFKEFGRHEWLRTWDNWLSVCLVAHIFSSSEQLHYLVVFECITATE